MISSYVQRQLHRLAGRDIYLYRSLKEVFKTNPELIMRLLEDPEKEEKIHAYFR